MYYPADYYAFTGLKKCNILSAWMKRWRWLFYKWNILRPDYPEYLRWLGKLKAKEKDSIADIGCGNGQVIYEMKCSGFKNLTGFDPYLNEEICDKGFLLKKGDIEQINGEFDILMLHHSFEHMEFPRKVFQKLNSLIKKGGKLLIRLPVTDGEVWKKERVNWFQLDAPRHFFIPSVEAMKLMGQQTGFQLQRLDFDGSEKQLLATEIYKKGGSFIGTDIRKIFSAEELKSFKIKAKKLNNEKKGDQVCLYFKKVSGVDKGT